MSYINNQFGDAAVHSHAIRTTFNNAGMVTGVSPISGMGADMTADLGTSPEAGYDPSTFG